MYGGSQNVDDSLIDAFSKWYKREDWRPAGSVKMDGWNIGSFSYQKKPGTSKLPVPCF